MSIFQHSGQLLLLSDEVLVDILSLLPSGLDLLNCSLCCTRLSRLVQDKKVLQTVSFRRELGITAQSFKQFFLPRAVCANIKGINLNSIYWLNSSLIFSNLMKMKNLERLHIADIQLTSNQFSSIISKLANLVSLSFTWTWTTVNEAEEVSASSLSKKLSQLSSLNMYISTSDTCPLDKVTWMLKHCTGLNHLAIFSEFLHKDVSYSINRFNITVSIRDMKFPKLKSLYIDMKNRTFPVLLEREFVSKIFAGLEAGNITKFWCSSYAKREFIATSTNSLELLTLCSPQSAPSLSQPLRARQASLSFSCEEEIFYHLCNPCPGLRKLSLHHLRPCHPTSRELDHTCHAALAKVMKVKQEVLEGLEELSYSTNGFEGKGDSNLRSIMFSMGKMLATLKFQNLTKVALPLCVLLSSPDQKNDTKLSSGTQPNKRISHDSARVSGRFSNSSFLAFVDNVPGLEHLEIASCPDLDCAKVGAEDILEAVTKLSNLETLILSKILVNFSSKPLFQRIFCSCPKLSHLHLNSLVCDVQKLCKDLVLGLKQAHSLRILKLFQKQWTQHSKSLLAALKESCLQLEQLVIIDSSKAFTLKQFPLAELVEIAQMESICLLYITSELLTTENIKKLKSIMRKISLYKPYFVSRFVKEFVQGKYAFYQLADVANLPMVYHRAVVSINSLSTSYCSNSSVANVTIEDVF